MRIPRPYSHSYYLHGRNLIIRMKDNKLTSRFCFTEVQFSEGEFNPDSEFEILTTAKQIDSRYGEFQYKRKELEQMAENFNNDIVGTEVAVDLNHDEECIALAWIKPQSMHVAPSKKLSGEYSLYAQLYRYTPKGEEYVSTGALRYFSVELQFKMERMIQGAKKVFKNVIRGLALTNRPVIKDMVPTFSENLNIHNPNTMEELKRLFGGLTAKDSITKEDFQKFSEAAEEAVKADPEVKEEVEEMAAELEPKVEEDKSADEAAKELAEKAAKKAMEEMKGKTFSEAEFKSAVEDQVKAALKEPLRKLNETLDNARSEKLEAKVNGLCLSESKGVGFKSDSKDKIKNFVKKLSDELAQEYFALHEGVIASVDLSEKGVESAMQDFQNKDAYKELSEKSEKYAKENDCTVGEATKRILSEDPELAKKIEEQEAKI